jgi:Protein of unknown function (DUF3106)
MSKGLKFASWLVALGLGVAVVLPVEAQNRPPKTKQEQHHERQQERQQHHNANRPPASQNSVSPNTNRPPASQNSVSPNTNRPPASQNSVSPNTNRPPEHARNQNPNRPPANAQTKKFESLNPEQKQRTLENNKDFERRTPAEKERIRAAQKNWAMLTPEQKSHIKNDVMPKWRQLPPDRQRAIGSRLNVLQNMPESARNQHLADPNFTRNMSEEDKSMLRDLSHLHVGGAPEEPHE